MPPRDDFNCCGEYAIMMALRATSVLNPEYPSYLVSRISALEALDKEFYIGSVLATDGEPEPKDPEPLREYRAARRHHILWSELKIAAAKIEGLERSLREATHRPPATSQ